MKIVNEFPPFYDKVIAAIPGVAKESHVVFTYGDVIYNPSGDTMPEDLIVHEEVHGAEQFSLGRDMWWELYLKSDAFRYWEELKAYRRQYRFFCEKYKDRNEQARFLDFIATCLSGPLYGQNRDKSKVKKAIRQ